MKKNVFKEKMVDKKIYLKKILVVGKNWVGKFCWLEILFGRTFFWSENFLDRKDLNYVKMMLHTKNELPRLGAGRNEVTPFSFTYFF